MLFLHALAFLAVGVAAQQPPSPPPHVEVVIHVAAEGATAPVGSEPDARVLVCRTESLLPGWRAMIPMANEGLPRARIGGSHTTKVPADEDIGFAVFSSARGYDEVVIPKETWASVVATEGRLELTLTLPALADSGEIQLIESFADVDREVSVRTQVDLILPRTGIILNPVGPWPARKGNRLRCPPGSYRLRSSVYCYTPCIAGPPEPAPAVGFTKTLEVREGETTRLEHSYVRGHTMRAVLALPPTVDATELAEREQGVMATRQHLTSTWWQHGLANEPNHWYVEAELQRKDPETGQLGEPVPLTWGWSPSWSEHRVVPLAQELYWVQRFPQGEYVMTVRGPKTVTRSVPIQLPRPAHGPKFETIPLELKAAAPIDGR